MQIVMGVSEVGDYLGVSKQTICNWRKRNKYFPQPITQLKMGPIWLTKDIIKFAMENINASTVQKAPSETNKTAEANRSSQTRKTEEK